MRLVKFLSAVFAATLGRIWTRKATGEELVVDKLLSTPEGRRKLASAMVEPRRRGLEYSSELDVTEIRAGDRVVFANPQSGWDHDIAAARREAEDRAGVHRHRGRSRRLGVPSTARGVELRLQLSAVQRD